MTDEGFRRRLARLIGKKPIKIWLAKSARGRIDVVFSVGVAQGENIRNFDHIGGFYLMGQNVPPEYIERIHQWFLAYCRSRFTPHRLERHYIDMSYRYYLDAQRRRQDELTLHVPLSVKPPSEG
jgi:hypothetical protein